MIQEANTLRDNLIEKINKAFQVTTENIDAFCKEKCTEITERMSKLYDSMKDYERHLLTSMVLKMKKLFHLFS